jgi:hypothetical protein
MPWWQGTYLRWEMLPQTEEIHEEIRTEYFWFVIWDKAPGNPQFHDLNPHT